MIIVRYTFQTKWGKAQEVVDEFKGMVEAMQKSMGVESPRAHPHRPERTFPYRGPGA